MLLLVLTENFAQTMDHHARDSLQLAWQLRYDSIAKIKRIEFLARFNNMPIDTTGRNRYEWFTTCKLA